MLKIYTPIAHIQSQYGLLGTALCHTWSFRGIYFWSRCHGIAENRVIAENTAANRADDEIAESVW
jgi:hypothetical protein